MSPKLTYFTTLQPPFPDIVDDKIDTVSFLKAAKGVVALVEKLGNVFSPIKYDMNGNIEKIQRKYETDPHNHRFLHDMLLSEREEGDKITIEALQWLRRALHFIVRFFECIIAENEKNTENLTSALKTAYSDTLQVYHSWMTRQLFTLLSRVCPPRSSIVKVLAMEKAEIDEEVVVKDMRIFTEQLKCNVLHLHDFYLHHNLEDTARV